MLSNITTFAIIGGNNNLTVHTVLMDDNVTISCTTTKGLPSPVIEIRKDTELRKSSIGSNTSETTLLYNFERISKKASGKYSCQVNTGGYLSTQTLQLEVKCE